MASQGCPSTPVFSRGLKTEAKRHTCDLLRTKGNRRDVDSPECAQMAQPISFGPNESKGQRQKLLLYSNSAEGGLPAPVSFSLLKKIICLELIGIVCNVPHSTLHL